MHWRNFRERGSILGIRIVIGTLNLLGYRAATWLLRPIVLYMFLTGRASRSASRHYLERVRRRVSGMAPVTWLDAWRHHYDFALTTLDRIWFWQGKTDRFRVTRRGREHLLARRGRGALLIGAHFGSFDALRIIGEEERLNVVAVMFRGNAENINRMIRAVASKSDVRIVELTPGDVGGVLELKAAVDQGEFVALLADRQPLAGNLRVSRVQFLGQPASFSHNPWVLAHLLECPVYLTVGIRTGDRTYELRAEPFADRILLPRVDRDRLAEESVARYARWLEDLCCEHPLQWFNFFDFWHWDEQ
jgi:predicted LPLAT superfamily acyltransferase